MSEKYAFIEAKKAQYPVVKMCAWFNVSTSGYYEWLERAPSATAERRSQLAALIRAIFDESDSTYGYRRIHAALVRQGDPCGAELVRVIMRELDLVPCQPRPWRPTTTRAGEGAEALPDLVVRNFTADSPGTKWSAISRIYQHGKGPLTWLRSSTAAPKNASDTRLLNTCVPN